VAWVAAAGTAFASGVLAVTLWPVRGAPLLDPEMGLRGREGVFIAGVAVVAACALAAVASLVIRFRQADGVERQQLKWVGLGAGLAVVGIVAAFVVPEYIGAGIVVVVVGLLALPLSIAVAVLRYRLYDIDRIISRTVAYAVLTALLGGLYVSGIFLLTPLVAGAGGGSELAVAASTLAVAAAVRPLRRRVQDVVDGRFNRARYDAQRTVSGFAGRLRDDVRLEDLRAELVSVVDEVMEPASASLWLRERAVR
jgi:hypothetical protein